MNEAEKLQKLIKEHGDIAESSRKQLDLLQRQCNHSFPKKADWNPEIERVPTNWKLEVHGSDAWSVPTNYGDKTVPRWSRTCTKCKKVEYTHSQKPSGYEPSFD